jgi:hypothetical protein
MIEMMEMSPKCEWYKGTQGWVAGLEAGARLVVLNYLISSVGLYSAQWSIMWAFKMKVLQFIIDKFLQYNKTSDHMREH